MISIADLANDTIERNENGRIYPTHKVVFERYAEALEMWVPDQVVTHIGPLHAARWVQQVELHNPNIRNCRIEKIES